MGGNTGNVLIWGTPPSELNQTTVSDRPVEIINFNVKATFQRNSISYTIVSPVTLNIWRDTDPSFSTRYIASNGSSLLFDNDLITNVYTPTTFRLPTVTGGEGDFKLLDFRIISWRSHHAS